MKPFLRRAWDGWLEIAGYFGDFQARLLLTVFYYVVFLPFGLVTRLAGDPLHVRRAPEGSGWILRSDHDADLEASRQQF